MQPEIAVTIVGRSSSHFTRVARIFARELEVPFDLEVVSDLRSLDVTAYGGHPALKIPTLRIGSSVVFGTENICRKLAEHAGRQNDVRVVWPEHLSSDEARCAQELTWHAMSAHVELITGITFAKLPEDSSFFTKIRAGMSGALSWLDAHVVRVLEELPGPRDLSLFEVTTFCLVDHLSFRHTIDPGPLPNLRAFAAEFATRRSARETEYRFDPAR